MEKPAKPAKPDKGNNGGGPPAESPSCSAPGKGNGKPNNDNPHAGGCAATLDQP